MAPTFSSLRRWTVALIVGLSTAANAAITVNNNVLIFAKDSASAYSAYAGLQGYGIPYTVVTVPSGGIALPALNSTTSEGNYGAIVVVSEVSYEYAGGNYASAITAAQWQQLYDYQTAFGVRMVRLDVYPGPDHGCEALGGTSVDQAITLTNTAGFPTANLKTGTGASMSTAGLYHYPAKITNATMATQVASFAAGGGFVASTAAVINVIGKRQQMAWFLPFSPEWSSTSSFLQHAWIHWATRGFYSGFRRTYFSTQIDDLFLETELYYPNTSAPFRVSTADMDAHKTWMPVINGKMPSGSKYMMELAHNGNGDIEASVSKDTGKKCNPAEAIEYDEQIDTPLEFMKLPGTGTDIWPPTPATYSWSLACAQIDPLLKWMTTNLNTFMHISHTFSHSSLNNATYSDVNKEITFNQAWLKQVGIDKATYFSRNGIVPPAITGLHNVDAIKAWMDNNITNVVGDNTRPVLMSTESPFWPLISTEAANGYAGLTIMPRWATNIYYNCDTPECTLREWIATSAGSGDFNYLLNDARATAARNMLGLRWDPYMFHQANLRAANMAKTTINGKSDKYSLLQMWVESVVNEMTRLTDWPLITLKHDDLAIAFRNRMTRDKCKPSMVYNYSPDGTKIVGGTVSAAVANCAVKVPVTFPGKVAALNGGISEQVGNDPLTVWVDVSKPSTFTLSTPISV